MEESPNNLVQATPTPAAEPPPLTSTDLCCGCDYALTSLKLSDRCPECNTPVSDSLLPNWIGRWPLARVKALRGWVMCTWLIIVVYVATIMAVAMGQMFLGMVGSKLLGVFFVSWIIGAAAFHMLSVAMQAHLMRGSPGSTRWCWTLAQVGAGVVILWLFGAWTMAMSEMLELRIVSSRFGEKYMEYTTWVMMLGFCGMMLGMGNGYWDCASNLGRQQKGLRNVLVCWAIGCALTMLGWLSLYLFMLYADYVGSFGRWSYFEYFMILLIPASIICGIFLLLSNIWLQVRLKKMIRMRTGAA